MMQIEKQARIERLPDGFYWAICPYCNKKALKLQPKTEMKHYLHRCHGSNCKRQFWINVDENKKGYELDFFEHARSKQAKIEKLLDGFYWAICPHCNKKALKLQPKTEMKNYLHRCQGSKCKREFWINVEEDKKKYLSRLTG